VCVSGNEFVSVSASVSVAGGKVEEKLLFEGHYQESKEEKVGESLAAISWHQPRATPLINI